MTKKNNCGNKVILSVNTLNVFGDRMQEISFSCKAFRFSPLLFQFPGFVFQGVFDFKVKIGLILLVVVWKKVDTWLHNEHFVLYR